jgi:copper(I)-binding protein
MNRTAALLALAATALAGAAHAQSVKVGALTLTNLAVRASLGSVPTTAAYLTIANAGKTPDALLSVDCACASMAMMHQSKTVNGVASMDMLDAVTIPAGGQVAFRPDGLHIMLTGVKAPLKAGGTQTLTLRFKNAGTVKAAFPILAVIPAPAGDMQGMPGMAGMPGMKP